MSNSKLTKGSAYHPLINRKLVTKKVKQHARLQGILLLINHSKVFIEHILSVGHWEGNQVSEDSLSSRNSQSSEGDIWM